MISWKMLPGCHRLAAENFLGSGAPLPPGLESIGRWHAPGSGYGWLLVSTDDAIALAQHVAEWANLLDLQVTPVIEDDEAATALGRAYGK
ncbi:MAG: DUF3303 domain-containing protein [Planctomycetota bacterium]|jgi:hypothetical protein